MNAAQQIRIWAGVVIGFLAAIGTFGMDASLVETGPGYDQSTRMP
jgi:hypothetical protein